MGVSLMLVRFPDGTIKYGSYQDTAGQYQDLEVHARP